MSMNQLHCPITNPSCCEVQHCAWPVATLEAFWALHISLSEVPTPETQSPHPREEGCKSPANAPG